MGRYSYATGALFSICLTALVTVLIAIGAEEMPRLVSAWPLLAALGASVVTWWLQGLIYAVLARPQRKGLRVSDMFRVEMAGLFVALVSPVRGAELPYKAYLLKRLGLSAGEGSNVVVTRVLLDAVILTPGALAALALYSSALPEVPNPNLLLAGAVLIATLPTIVYLICRRVWGSPGCRTLPPGGSGWQAKAQVKISGFLRDMHRSFTSYWRPGHRATLLYAVILTVVYWALRLCAGPLALMTVGWSGDWIPVIVAQLLLVSFVLPLAPTPGGGGVRELGLSALLASYMPEGQLFSGLIVYTALSHWLPLIASALVAGHELWRGSITHTTPPQRHVSSSSQEPEETRTWQHNKASPPKDRIPGGSSA